MMDVTPFILLAGVLSSLYLLFGKGEKDWYMPLVAVALTLLVPHLTCLTFKTFIPLAQCPVYTYGVYDVDAQLRAAAEAIESVSSTALAVASGLAVALGVHAAVLTAINVLLAVASFGASAAIEAALDVVRYFNLLDPVWQILLSAYNVAMGIGMAYHVLAIVARAAESFVPLLLALGMALMLLPRVRAVGAMLYALGLLLYVGAMAGYYFAQPAAQLTSWANSTLQWASNAPTPAVNYSGLLATYGGGMFFGRYVASPPQSAYIQAWSPGWGIELPVYSDYAAGLGVMPVMTPVVPNATMILNAIFGNGTLVFYQVNWTGLGSGRPYVVYDWLDVPRTPVRESLRYQYPWRELGLYPLPSNVTIGNMSANEFLERAWSVEANITSLWRVYTGPQPFWLPIRAKAIVEVYYGNGSIFNGTEEGAIGVWGWLKAPAQYACYAGGDPVGCAGDLTDRKGLLVYNESSGAIYWRPPALKDLLVKLNLTLPQAP